jgi:hypothetical protein
MSIDYQQYYQADEDLTGPWSPLPEAPGKTRSRRSRLLALMAVPVAIALVAAVVEVASAGTDASPSALPGVIRADSYSAMSGARTENTTDAGGGKNVGWLANGDWMSYDKVDLGAPGPITTRVRVAAATDAGGAVELHADSQTGTLLARFPIRSTGGWQKWITASASGESTLSGQHTVFIVLRSDQHADFVNINWFSIGTDPTGADPTGAPPSEPAQVPPSPTAGAGGSLTVDPAAQATAAFFARTPRPVTGNPVKVPEFHAACTVSHHASDDPIVFPGIAGKSHNHTFFGNKTTIANSTPESLRAGDTTCTPKEDHSSYWVPTLYQNGNVVDPVGDVTIYYGSRLADPGKTQPFPFGLRMISGDPRVQVDTPDHQGNHFWCAGIGGEVGRSADGVFPICAKTAQLVRQITFPDCWDGKRLDSPDHKAHMANGVGAGVCPASHPVQIPSVSFVIAYPLNSDTNGITLSSGTSFSMHADFFNAWDDNAQAERVRNCLDQGVKCNAAGGF